MRSRRDEMMAVLRLYRAISKWTDFGKDVSVDVSPDVLWTIMQGLAALDGSVYKAQSPRAVDIFDFYLGRYIHVYSREDLTGGKYYARCGMDIESDVHGDMGDDE